VKLWEDRHFPATDSSLYGAALRPDYLPPTIQWLRPSQIVKTPQLVTAGVTKFDIQQVNCIFNLKFNVVKSKSATFFTNLTPL
jgi:Calpain family cysteine protease